MTAIALAAYGVLVGVSGADLIGRPAPPGTLGLVNPEESDRKLDRLWARLHTIRSLRERDEQRKDGGDYAGWIAMWKREEDMIQREIGREIEGRYRVIPVMPEMRAGPPGGVPKPKVWD